MRKRLFFTLMFAMSVCLLCACQAERIPTPDYPLDAAVIEAELKTWGLDCTMEEEELVKDRFRGEQSSYHFYSVEDDKYVLSVQSIQEGEERVLVVAFPAFSDTNPIPLQECEDAVAFATRLFGGFESSHQVYSSFIKDYDTVNTEKVQHESTLTRGEGESYWERNIGGTVCRIVLEQPSLSDPQEYVRDIIFITDWDTFFL